LLQQAGIVRGNPDHGNDKTGGNAKRMKGLPKNSLAVTPMKTGDPFFTTCVEKKLGPGSRSKTAIG